MAEAEVLFEVESTSSTFSEKDEWPIGKSKNGTKRDKNVVENESVCWSMFFG
jgi:hypothetical protein